MSLPDLYARWTLDCIVDAALGVAHDFIKRPRQYHAAQKEDCRNRLANFRDRLGSDPDWPNAAKRAAIYGALVGPSDAKPGEKPHPFHHAAMVLRDAAAAYAERVHDSGEHMLKQAFLDAADSFKAYLQTLEGAVLDDASVRTANVFNQALEVLRDENLTRAFGLQPASPNPWPVDGAKDGKGAALIEEITRTLQPSAGPLVSLQQFLTLQRVASRGKTTIERVLAGAYAAPDGADKTVQNQADEELHKLLTDAYAWTTALRAVGK